MGVGREAKVIRQKPFQKRDPIYRDKTSRLESTWHLGSPLRDRQEKILSEKPGIYPTFSYWFVLIFPVP